MLSAHERVRVEICSKNILHAQQSRAASARLTTRTESSGKYKRKKYIRNSAVHDKLKNVNMPVVVVSVVSSLFSFTIYKMYFNGEELKGRIYLFFFFFLHPSSILFLPKHLPRPAATTAVVLPSPTPPHRVPRDACNLSISLSYHVSYCAGARE